MVLHTLELTNKAMYCYNCYTSDEIETKTIYTTNGSWDPISKYVKYGAGYAKISLLVENEENKDEEVSEND